MAHSFFKKRIANENLVVKRQEKGLQFDALVCADAEEVGIVMVQYPINRTEPSVMHIGLGIAKVSQAGHLEPVEVADISGNNIPT